MANKRNMSRKPVVVQSHFQLWEAKKAMARAILRDITGREMSEAEKEAYRDLKNQADYHLSCLCVGQSDFILVRQF